MIIIICKQPYLQVTILNTNIFYLVQIIFRQISLIHRGEPNSSNHSVTYWPRPSCQKKKCTCVNNRCIQSKISGDNLDCRRVELSANVMLTRGKWASNNYITRVRQEVRSVGEKMLDVPAEPPAPGWAVLENEKEMLLWPEEWGSICCSSVQSPTHLSQIIPFVTLSNKVRGIFF